ncbi:GNAT family N-acetyltransferase [Paeniglutamicibacter sp. MACA_103]|uniref:GNAT family N-acetyltransferase n=1 Tax=Paeniglutamicibacter sp. MACA_103 TaxID=3377337 RepID=UPI00389453EC
MEIATRVLQLGDVPELTELLRKNRTFLGPWDPLRDDAFFTVAKQGEIARHALHSHENGDMVPLVILNATGGLAGRLNISGIVRGAFQSGALGYWVSRDENGAGLASQAVAEAIDLATALNLHRLQAGTLPHNAASQRVLEKNGFRRFGLAPKYLKIAGRWQDHVLYQRILEQDQP